MSGKTLNDIYYCTAEDLESPSFVRSVEDFAEYMDVSKRDVWFNIAVKFDESGKKDMALVAYRRSVKHGPFFPDDIALFASERVRKLINEGY